MAQETIRFHDTASLEGVVLGVYILKTNRVQNLVRLIEDLSLIPKSPGAILTEVRVETEMNLSGTARFRPREEKVTIRASIKRNISLC